MSTFTDLDLPSSDQRRKDQARFARLMPTDAAAAAVALTLPTRGPGRPADLTVKDHGSGLPALLRSRVLVPLVEPNVLGWGRMITRKAARYPSTGDDGVVTVEWGSPAEHAAATGAVVRDYEERHSAVTHIAQTVRYGRLDSWNSPLALIPVRHTYADGSPSVLRWLAADGTARIVGARLAIADAFGPWLGEHPYADPYAYWPADMVTLRQFLAAGRAEIDRIAAEGLPADAAPYGNADLAHPGIEDFGDLILPPTAPEQGRLVDKVGQWNFRTHTSGNEPKPEAFEESLRDYLANLDVWSGLDPFEVMSRDPANQNDRRDVAEDEAEVRDWLATVGGPETTRVQRLALFAVAVSDPRTAPTGPGDDPDEQYRVADQHMWQYAATTLGYNGWARAVATDACMIRDILTERLGVPALSDLYGVYLDVTNGYVNEPLRDPANPWWWLGAAQGLLYADVLGHLPVDPFEETVTALLSTHQGRRQILAYADALQDGVVKVPLVDAPEGTYATRADLIALAQTAATAEG